MKIGIIGAGNIGGALGKVWAGAGHAVCFGVRNPQDPKFDPLRAFAAVEAVGAASEVGEVVVLALPGGAVADFVAEWAGALSHKTLIDATNNIRQADMSSLSLLATQVPTARLVRAFSNLGWENFADPQIDGITVDLFYCVDTETRPTADALISAVGLRPVYLGGREAAPAVDGLTRAWFALALGQGYGRRLAFKLLVED